MENWSHVYNSRTTRQYRREDDMESSFDRSSTCSSFDSESTASTSSSHSQYSICKRNGRRGGVQMKSNGPDFTVKNGQWTLWVDTLPRAELNNYKVAFSMFDRKRKGRIGARHLGELMRSLGYNPLEQELSDLIDEFTDRNSSRITFPEFVTIMAQKRRSSDQYIRDTLDVLDKEGKGLVPITDLQKNLATIGDQLKPEEIAEIFTDLDIDDDGNVSYDDLVDMISTAPEVFDEPEKQRTQRNRKMSEYTVKGALKSFFGT